MKEMDAKNTLSLADVPRYQMRAAASYCVLAAPHGDATAVWLAVAYEENWLREADIEALVQRLEEERAHAMFDADERDALIARAEQAEASLKKLRVFVQQLEVFIGEVWREHRTDGDVNYNGCEAPGGECAWCQGTREVLDALLKEAKS